MRAGTRLGAAALFALTLGPLALVPTAAQAAPAAVLSVGAAALEASVQPSGDFTVAVDAPAGSSVKFKLDGSDIGQDKTAPYTAPVQTDEGDHKVTARWNGGSATAEFSVDTTAPLDVVQPTNAVPVSTAAELKAALKAAQPGQTILLADGTYTGAFVAAASGTTDSPITLTGSRAAVLTTGSLTTGYALHITGSDWVISQLSISKASKGIVLDHSERTTISAVDVGNVGAEAIHLRADSTDAVIENSIIHDTGVRQPGNGEGIYVGSSFKNWASVMGSSAKPDRSDWASITGNTFTNTAAEGIDVKEGTTGGTISGNTFLNSGFSDDNSADSWIDVKGNSYLVSKNSGSKAVADAMQVHRVRDGWGRKNTFESNLVVGGVPGFAVWIDPQSVGNTVDCVTSAARKGQTNAVCAP